MYQYYIFLFMFLMIISHSQSTVKLFRLNHPDPTHMSRSTDNQKITTNNVNMDVEKAFKFLVDHYKTNPNGIFFELVIHDLIDVFAKNFNDMYSQVRDGDDGGDMFEKFVNELILYCEKELMVDKNNDDLSSISFLKDFFSEFFMMLETNVDTDTWKEFEFDPPLFDVMFKIFFDGIMKCKDEEQHEQRCVFARIYLREIFDFAKEINEQLIDAIDNYEEFNDLLIDYLASDDDDDESRRRLSVQAIQKEGKQKKYGKRKMKRFAKRFFKFFIKNGEITEKNFYIRYMNFIKERALKGDKPVETPQIIHTNEKKRDAECEEQKKKGIVVKNNEYDDCRDYEKYPDELVEVIEHGLIHETIEVDEEYVYYDDESIIDPIYFSIIIGGSVGICLCLFILGIGIVVICLCNSTKQSKRVEESEMLKNKLIMERLIVENTIEEEKMDSDYSYNEVD